MALFAIGKWRGGDGKVPPTDHPRHRCASINVEAWMSLNSFPFSVATSHSDRQCIT